MQVTESSELPLIIPSTTVCVGLNRFEQSLLTEITPVWMISPTKTRTILEGDVQHFFTQRHATYSVPGRVKDMASFLKEQRRGRLSFYRGPHYPCLSLF